MNELIEEAEKLYEEIDTIQMLWVASTKDNDEEGIRYAIGRMGVAMCSAMQLLKCFIDRKDNIVDLSEVWHEISVEPEYDDKRLVFECKDGFISYCSTKSQAVKCWGTWERVSLGATVRWAYVDDLLPKGGE